MVFSNLKKSIGNITCGTTQKVLMEIAGLLKEAHNCACNPKLLHPKKELPQSLGPLEQKYNQEVKRDPILFRKFN